ncbi:chaplin [Streptomyces sp. NPDC046977]|uniref:chaplin n=1 Tax=Streptomyces sp. NPDC046977 TaxID=3154703 RepID=UPI00340CEC3F
MRNLARTVVLTATAAAAAVGGASGALADDGGYGTGGASARAAAVGSPGFASGNILQLPRSFPFNFCGNTITPVPGFSLLNPALGNVCINA